MNKIRELRNANGMTQSDLAKRLNTSTSNVSGWECGKWQPDNDALVKLAELFAVSVDYLLGADEHRKEPDALTTEERRLLEGYREINTAGKKLVMQTVETLRNTAAGSGSGTNENKIG